MKENITIVGPRSVGKSTISKYLSKKIKYNYIESDSVMNEKMKEYGGLDKATKSGKIKEIMNFGSSVVRDSLNSERVLLDLAGGAISSSTGIKMGICQDIILKIKESSFVIGLLPFKDKKRSIDFLFARELKRKHFLSANRAELKVKVKKDYLKIIKVLKEVSDIVIYVEKKDVKEIVKEIISALNK